MIINTGITDATTGDTQAPYQLPGTTSYSYDENGNLLSRSNAAHPGNNITSTAYNILNLPRQVATPSGTISYTYDATGRKLRSIGAQPGGTRDYIDGIEYSGGTLELIHTEEGWIVKSGTSYTYDYLLKDHLGNNRVGFRQGSAGVPNFSTDYYPFGLQYQARIRQSSPKNNYLYNGKELQEALTFFDYGARFYDPVVGRWNVPDPLSELARIWSPYNYAWNNPLRFIDPDGMFATPPGDFYDEKGRYLGTDGIDDKRVYIVKTTQTNFDSGVPSAGISKGDAKATESFIKKNSGDTEAFKNNSIAFENSVEIVGEASVRQEMVNIVNQDDGRGGTSDANNREYGGVARKGRVIESPMGAVGNPKTNLNVFITHPDVRAGDITFHSHPSGQIIEGAGANHRAGTTIGGSTTTYQWGRAPSAADIAGATGTGYTFSRGNGTIYIYNKSGVVATIPQVRFVVPKR